MKRLLFMIIFLPVVAHSIAQNKRPKLSLESFRAEKEQFIAKEACLTPQESADFFPLYNEMNQKQRIIFDQMRKMEQIKPTDERSCKEAIERRDQLDLELKQIQQTYHNKFMSVISASKLFDIIKAEDKFHRRMLKKYSHPQNSDASEEEREKP